VRTEELVSLLATGNDATDLRRPQQRFLVATLAGTAVAMLVMSQWLGVRSTLVRDVTAPLFWVKEAFCLALSLAGLLAVICLGRPGSPLGPVWVRIAAPLVALWLLAALTLIAADQAHRAELIFGQTARVCSARIALISTPLFVAMLAALRGFAPTRPALAGASAGFAAGSVGALVYSLHCPELEPPFLGIWYVLGVLIPTSIGAALGPRVLRW
jgi:hypothetical protein